MKPDVFEGMKSAIFSLSESPAKHLGRQIAPLEKSWKIYFNQLFWRKRIFVTNNFGHFNLQLRHLKQISL